MPRERSMAEGSYQQFCPVAMAAEILCTRWTVVLLRELLAGSTRFNELRRGVARMSPALLAKRLRDLEAAGIITRTPLAGEAEIHEYKLTAAGRDLLPVVEAVGIWGQRWVESKASLQHLDPGLLMWDMRRNLDTSPMPRQRSTIQFIYGDQPQSRRNFWLIVEPGKAVDLCSIDPGFEVDLYVTSDLRTMTAIWMGLETVARALDDGRLQVSGARQLEAAMQSWLGLSPFAKEKKLVA
jgi:DNA-binding HxlR family transcriptional regulator